MFILGHIYSPFGAAYIALHQRPLTIQEEAPPPQWLTPISCVWLGHWCRTKLWHCTSQSKLCSLSLLSLGLINSLMFKSLPNIANSKLESVLCVAIMISSMDYCVFSLWKHSKESLESKEETSEVVTVRVVRKEGWCTVGEIDSYLDENEAWCLWGERRAALASKWRGFTKMTPKWITNSKTSRSLQSYWQSFYFWWGLFLDSDRL